MKDDMKEVINTQRGAVMGAVTIWIALFHLWISSGEFVAFEYIKNVGFVGVDVFFLLSGMGLVYAAEKYTTLAFYRRRLERVFLPYAVTAVAFSFLQGWSVEAFLKNVLCISFYTTHITSFLWFVPAVLTLYFLFPFYYRGFRRAAHKGWFTLGTVLVWLALSRTVPRIQVVSDYFQRTWMFLFTNRIPVFITGIYLGWRLKEGKAEFPIWGWGLCAAVFLLGLYALDQTYFCGQYLLVEESFCFLPTYLMAVSGVPLMAKAAQLLGRYGSLPGKLILKVLTLFGRISLEFYCVHEYLGEKIRIFLEGRATRMQTNLVMLAGSLAAALVLDAVCRCLRKGLAGLGSEARAKT